MVEEELGVGFHTLPFVQSKRLSGRPMRLSSVFQRCIPPAASTPGRQSVLKLAPAGRDAR